MFPFDGHCFSGNYEDLDKEPGAIMKRVGVRRLTSVGGRCESCVVCSRGLCDPTVLKQYLGSLSS